jgi:hypothetical protein
MGEQVEPRRAFIDPGTHWAYQSSTFNYEICHPEAAAAERASVGRSERVTYARETQDECKVAPGIDAKVCREHE